MTQSRSKAITKQEVKKALNQLGTDTAPSSSAIRDVLGRGSKSTIIKLRDEIWAEEQSQEMNEISQLEETLKSLSILTDEFTHAVQYIKQESSHNALIQREITESELMLEQRQREMVEQLSVFQKKIKKLKKKIELYKSQCHEKELNEATLYGEIKALKEDKFRLQDERDILIELVPSDLLPEGFRGSVQEEITFKV